MTEDKLLYNKIISTFENNRERYFQNDTPAISKMRQESIDLFKKNGFPDKKLESWKNTDLKQVLDKDYSIASETLQEGQDISNVFKCKIHDFDTDQISLLNGRYMDQDKALQELPNGVIIGSLVKAMEKYPELIEKYFGKYASPADGSFTALNTAFATDGFFMYVPDNVIIEKPVQMVSIINWHEPLMVQTRNLVIMGKNTQLTLVHCDDSTNQESIFKNSISEIHIGENASLDHYKLQNLNNDSSLINSTYFHQEENSNLTTNAVTLNGGLIRNYTHVTLNGKGASADIQGVYLMDKKQHVDNQVFVDHASPDCYSNELFKGIVDEEASAVFNGHVLVRKDSQKTQAYQTNKNILMTDNAKVNAKPFLEIYADDVKCSHGATVGQLDPDAMFYLRARGICEANARLLLLYAFVAEVINHIKIEALKVRVDDMIKQRLRGELHVCETCALHCEGPNKEIIFDIDITKV